MTEVEEPVAAISIQMTSTPVYVPKGAMDGLSDTITVTQQIEVLPMTVPILAKQTTWETLGLPNWREVAALYARPRPCAPLSLDRLSVQNIAELIVEAVKPFTNGNHIRFPEYSGAIVHAKLGAFKYKLPYDPGHAAFVGWLPHTLANPIEVWDHEHGGTMKRHYFSAYRGESGAMTMHYLGIAALNMEFATGFRKTSVKSIDEGRNGDPIYRCY